MRACAGAGRRWKMLADSFARPYPVTLPMVVLMALIPFYLFIPGTLPERQQFVPELALDRWLPVLPAWAIVYGAAYVFLIVLPVLVVRQRAHIRRMYLAYVSVWITAYAGFLLLPTVAPRPATVAGEGFAVWGLRFLYAADPPNNCFPSLHVAHSFVSALSCHRVHRGLGVGAALCALLVAVSTVLAKQHYILDIAAGVLLASLAYLVVLRGCRREQVPELDQQVAPVMAAGAAGIAGLATVILWVAYRLNLS
jgi:membrane-associated phospholipid phosphatase